MNCGRALNSEGERRKKKTLPSKHLSKANSNGVEHIKREKGNMGSFVHSSSRISPGFLNSHQLPYLVWFKCWGSGHGLNGPRSPTH